MVVSLYICVVLKTGVEVDPSIIERLKVLARRLRNIEAKNNEVSQSVISLRSSTMGNFPGDTKSNNTKVRNADLMNDTQLTLPSIYNYMSHLLGSKNSLVPAFHLSAGRSGGIEISYVL